MSASRKLPENYGDAISRSTAPEFIGDYSIRGNDVNFLFTIGENKPSIYDEFRGGTGPKNSVFLDNHPLTQAVKNWADVDDLKFYAYEKFERLKRQGKDLYSNPYTNFGNYFNPFVTVSGGAIYWLIFW